jgi:hypothetical protein
VALLAAIALVVPGVAVAVAVALDRPATVGAPAEWTGTEQIAPLVAAPDRCARVVVIGDSLMDNARPWLHAGLRDAGVTFVIDAQPSRRIPATVRVPLSGVQAALFTRSSWGDADCWIVALGSNDLIFGAHDASTAAAMIDEMLAAVTPDARVWWVNLHYRRDPRTSFDFPAATAVFNAELDRRADSDPRLAVVDWYSLVDANQHWFFDPVHVDRTGSIARAQQAVAALGSP